MTTHNNVLAGRRGGATTLLPGEATTPHIEPFGTFTTTIARTHRSLCLRECNKRAMVSGTIQQKRRGRGPRRTFVLDDSRSPLVACWSSTTTARTRFLFMIVTSLWCLGLLRLSSSLLLPASWIHRRTLRSNFGRDLGAPQLRRTSSGRPRNGRPENPPWRRWHPQHRTTLLLPQSRRILPEFNHNSRPFRWESTTTAMRLFFASCGIALSIFPLPTLAAVAIPSVLGGRRYCDLPEVVVTASTAASAATVTSRASSASSALYTTRFLGPTAVRLQWPPYVRRRYVFGAFLLGWMAISFVDWVKVRRRQSRDATSEWSKYAKNPAARGRALVSLTFQLAPLVVASRITNRHALLTQAGRKFADGLLKLGPLYIKLGQIVSCRDKLLPDEWKVALERLQDQVPSRNGPKALELAYAAWPGGETDFHNVFSDFDTTPLAAASLGQVHRATLAATGDRVAIKLQRPYLREIYDQDLSLLNKIAATVDKFGGSAGQVGGVSQSWVDIFHDAQDILYREIDYRDEADNMLRFCRDFGLDRGGRPAATPSALARDGNPLPSAALWLRAPVVYRDLSSEKVLVMEYVPSIKITNKLGLAAANVTADEQEYLADMLARSYLRQFCCNLFFSTDPHPGNLGVEIVQESATLPRDRVRLVFYDFGQAASLNRDQADGILSIVEAIVDSDVDRSMEAFQQMGVLKDTADLGKVRAKVADNYKTGKVKANRKRLRKRGYKFKDANTGSNPTNSTPTSESDNSTATTSATDAEIMQYFTLPAEYAFVGRALSQMDGVGKSLDSEFDFISSAAPWIVEIKGAGKYLQDEATKLWKSFVQAFELDRLLPHYVDRPHQSSE